MEKNEIIKRIAGSPFSEPEDRTLLGHVLDKLEACQRGNVLTYTKFLNERQQVLITNLLAAVGHPKHRFFGGYEEAQRTILIFIPDYLQDDLVLSEEALPLGILRAEYAAESKLTHRDFLGSLMGCGIKREMVGDILPGESSCDIVVLKEVATYLLTTLVSVGKVKINIKEIGLNKFDIPAKEFKIIRDTVASLRLDSVVSSGFLISREKASDAIRSGKVTLNHLEMTKPDKAVNEGDRISFRGRGKIELDQIGQLTKKGRISIQIKKY